MAKEWMAICKDCGKEFGYSDWSYQSGTARGHSRPERCPDCRKVHNRQTGTMGLSYFDLKPRASADTSKVQTSGLGALSHPPREHRAHERESHFDPNKFGMSDDDVKAVFDWLRDADHQVAVVVGPTGSGKSTALPYRLIAPPEGVPADQFTKYGQIVITQPRIQATRNIPAYVAKDLYGSSIGAGFDIGFRHSNNPYSDWRNRLVYVTDGTLINWTVTGQIANLSVIMIDEAHERSLNIDLILGLLKRLLPRYPHLKSIIASATIEVGEATDAEDGDIGAGELVDTVLTDEDSPVTDPEEEVIPPWVDLADDTWEVSSEPSLADSSEPAEMDDTPSKISIGVETWPGEPLCYLETKERNYMVGDSLSAEVNDYNFDNITQPAIVLRPVPEREPFDIFVDRYHVGDYVTVTVTDYDERPGDYLVSLVVREQLSGLEVLLEPEDLSFTTRGFAVKEVPIGTEFQVVVENIDELHHRIYLSCLPFVEAHLNEAIQQQRSKEGIYEADAVVGEVAQDMVFLKLGWSEPPRAIVHIVGTAGGGTL